MAEDTFTGSIRGVQLRGSRYPGFASRALSDSGNVPAPTPSTPTVSNNIPVDRTTYNDGSPGRDEDDSMPDASYDDFALGGRFPNASALGIDDNISRIASNIPGPVGSVIGGINTVGNVVNTQMNAEDLAKMGTPLSFGQRIGGFLGLNDYNGTLSKALNAKMGTEEGRGALTRDLPTTDEINKQIANNQPAFTYEAPQRPGTITTETLGEVEGRDATRDFGGTGNGAERDGNETSDLGGRDGGSTSAGGGPAERDTGHASGGGGTTSGDASAPGDGGAERDGTDTAPGGDDSGGGDGGGGGGDRVICTELVRQRLVQPEFVRLDAHFSFKHLTQTHYDGYQAWAVPFVRVMRRPDWIGFAATRFILPLVKWRMEAVRYALGERESRHIRGRVMRAIFEGLSYGVGMAMGVKPTPIVRRIPR